MIAYENMRDEERLARRHLVDVYRLTAHGESLWAPLTEEEKQRIQADTENIFAQKPCFAEAAELLAATIPKPPDRGWLITDPKTGRLEPRVYRTRDQARKALRKRRDLMRR